MKLLLVIIAQRIAFSRGFRAFEYKKIAESTVSDENSVICHRVSEIVTRCA
jgi:hypothetical protein